MAVKLMYLQAAVCTVSAILLLYKRVAAHHRWLIAYLSVQAVLAVPGALLYPHQNAYGWFYFCSAAFSWLTPFGAAIETYSDIMQRHIGIKRLGSRVLYAALVVGAVLSTIGVFTQLTVDPTATQLYQRAVSIESSVRFALLIVWLILILFIVLFRVSLSRNTVIFTLLFGGYFLATSVATVLQAAASDLSMNRSIGLARGVFVVCFQLAWGILLTRVGETRMVRIGYRWNPQEEAKLLAQLDAINEHLIATTRSR
jgi:hypothetical protein